MAMIPKNVEIIMRHIESNKEEIMVFLFPDETKNVHHILHEYAENYLPGYEVVSGQRVWYHEDIERFTTSDQSQHKELKEESL